MSLDPGSITIDPGTGADSGSGCAYAVFQDYDAKISYGTLTGAQLATAKQQVADLCESIGQVIVNYVVANAEVTTTGTAANVTSGGDTANTSSTGTIS